MSSNIIRTLASGIALWAIMLLLPAAHIGFEQWLTPIGLLALFGPLPILLLALRKQRLEWLLVLFPAALLPAILLRPEIISHSVYGLLEFIILMAVTVVYFHAAVTRPFESRASVPMPISRRSLKASYSRAVISITILAFAILAVPSLRLHFDTGVRYQLAKTFGESNSQATMYIGLLFFTIWTIVIIQLMIRNFAAALLEEHPYKAEIYRFRNLHLKRLRARSQLKWATIVGLIFGLLLLAMQSTESGI